MKVSVDADLCTGHGRCYSLAPQLFDSDESGFCVQRGSSFPVIADHEVHALAAAANCPEQAITIGSSDRTDAANLPTEDP